ncbi:MAG: outer membrane beta-barrel protein [Bacteroidetes bacterium]|nr:outer membrane beta-barrel protein [Bacteroidota bacterium]
MKYFLKQSLLVLVYLVFHFPELRAQLNNIQGTALNEIIKTPIEGTEKQEQIIDAANVAGFHFGLRYQPFMSDIEFVGQSNRTVLPYERINQGWGATLNYYLSNWIAIHVEVINQHQRYEFRDSDILRNVKLNYVNIPMMVSANTNYGRSVNLNIAAGPYLGLNTKGQIATNGQAKGFETPVLLVNPLDFGAAFGGGIDFAFGAHKWLHLNLGYRGTIGLTSITDNNIILDENQYSIIGKNTRNRTNGAYIGLMAKF